MKKRNIFIVLLLLVGISLNAQIKFGVTAGLNMASEGTSLSSATFSDKGSFQGLTLGPTVEAMIPIIGIGGELSALYSRKGSNFQYNINTSDVNVSLNGYRSISYIDIPLNLKYKIGVGLVNIYVVGGWYWSVALGGKVVVDNAIDINGNAIPELVKSTNMNFSNSYDSFDTGWDIGAGVELFKKIQVGINYIASVKNTATQQALQDILNENYTYTGSFSTKNRVLSIRLTYLF